MIKWINSWVQGIIIAVIISTVIEMILPDGNIKKYIKTVIGAYIVFVIISPIITKITGKEINLSSYEMPKVSKYETSSIDTNTYIEETYIKKIENDIIKKIEEKGYSVISVKIEIEQTEANYGNINLIELNITNKKDVSNIEPIKINISDKTEKQETIDESKFTDLRKFLKETYGTPEENIVIIE